MPLLPSSLLPSPRAMVAFAHDVFMVAVSFGVSLGLRLGFNIDPFHSQALIPGTLLFTLIAIVVFLSLRLYRGIWRYASMNDLVALSKAVTILVVVFAVIGVGLWRIEGLPRSVPLINWFVLMALLGGPRFAYRLMKDRNAHNLDNGAIPVLLLGAGDEADLFIRSTTRTPSSAYRPVGIVAESKNRVGRLLHGVAVLGTLDEIETIISNLASADRPQRLVLTKSAFKGIKVRSLLETAERLGMSLARMPSLQDLKSGTGDNVPIRPIAIEDLLGRPQQPLDRAAMAALVQNKRVLITGAGGSIGSELVRQVASLDPARVLFIVASKTFTTQETMTNAHSAKQWLL
ncbi:MAG: nucleotide sugar dehydratase, partial [Rhodospirillaceae bacterium]